MIRTLIGTAVIGAFLTAAPSMLRADVTIHYTVDTSIPMMPAMGQSHPRVVYMKGNKGVTVEDNQTMIADFSKQQITIIDSARKKYATIAAADYAAKMTAAASGIMPDVSAVPGVADMLKGMKTACETKDSMPRKASRAWRASAMRSSAL